MTPLTVVSLFAGVGGFDLAFDNAGANVVAAVEIDEPARAVLARRFPDTALFPDVMKVSGDDLRRVGFVPERGVITGGFPCQDVSVAGRREGLAGARTGLFWEIVRLLADLRPAWVVLENVPGLLSSDDGRDMGAVLGALADLGYGYAYRVLDAKHFGVPQQRRRVFIVGHLGTPFGAAAQVLLEPESGVGNSPSGSQTRPGTTALAAVGAPVVGERIDTHTHTHTQRPCRAAGSAATGSTPNRQQAGTSSSRKWVAALTADGVGTCGADDNQAQAGHIVEQAAYQCHGSNVGPIGTLRRGNGALTGGVPFTVQPLALRGRDGGAQLEIGEEGAAYNALRAGDGGSSRQSLVAITSLHENQQGELSLNSHTGPVSTGGGKPGQGYPAVLESTVVRRLTPLECERLQGFPDGWTDGQSDAQRYRQMGNAVAVPVVEWIARRLIDVDHELHGGGDAA